MSLGIHTVLAIVSCAAGFALFTVSILLFINIHRCSVSTAQLLSHTFWTPDSKMPITHKLFICGLIMPTILLLSALSVVLNGLTSWFPNNYPLLVAHSVALIVVILFTFIGGIIQWKLFRSVIDIVEAATSDHDECLNHGGNSLNAVMEMVKESVMVLSEDLTVLHCNHASHKLFSVPLLAGVPLLNFIHADDVRKFNDVVTRTLASYSRETFTAEFRVRSHPPPVNRVEPRKNYSNKCHPNWKEGERCGRHGSGGTNSTHNSVHSVTQPRTYRIHCDDTERPSVSVHTQADYAEEVIVAPHDSRDSIGAEYVWIECTMCKGTRLNESQEYDYSIKMVARDINERKRREQSQYNDIIKETEELGRVNAAKLRYLSCITHDLKTPLQSFSYTLDLLTHTPLLVEQSEFIEQANVAVDLMRLTISQTMDISKALTGAKLMPRRTTVSLSAVLKRVKIIIDGYGKQVPLYYNIQPDICDEIITDEEWLWQMLLNLLTNACKYTDKGSIRLEVSVPNNKHKNNSLSSSLEYSSKKSSNSLSGLTGVNIMNTVTVPVLPSALMSELKVNIPPNPKTAMLLIEVYDTGVGVSQEKISTLFDAFSQVQEGQSVGTGLGLYGVRTRAEGLSGTCGARHNTESATGTGTVLWFSIPYTPDPSARYMDSTAVSPQVRLVTPPPLHPTYNTPRSPGLVVNTNVFKTVSSDGDGSVYVALSPSAQAPRHSLRSENAAHVIRDLKLSVMVVEDTMSVRKLMEKLLYAMGFEKVVCYENGAKGLEAMMAGSVDIVFSDVQMPIMTGPEMVKRFRVFETSAIHNTDRLHRQLIVAVTANGSDLSVSTEGFDEICAKPLSRRDINRIVLERFDDVKK